MKIVYINTLFYPLEIGGAEKSLRNLISALKEHHGIEAVVITLNEHSAQQDVVDQVDGVQVYRLGYRNTRFIFGPRGSLLNRILWHANDYDNKAFDSAIDTILVTEQPDLVHTNNLLGFSARPIHLARRRNIPVVHTLRDYYFQCWKSGKFKNGQNCQTPCTACTLVSRQRRHYADMVSCVVGNSAFILNDHVNHHAFSAAPRRSVIYNIYEPDTAAESRTRQPGDPIRLGYMGRLNQEKGIRELVDLVGGVPGYTLVVAGDGELRPHVEAAAARCDNVTYLGHVDPQALAQAIDILVVPSLWHEPLSRTIFEAYSYGIPVIGSTCGGTPEIIEPQVTGALFDPADFASILSKADALCSTLGLYERVSENCLDYSKKFSRKHISGAYFDLYTDTLTTSRQPAT